MKERDESDGVGWDMGKWRMRLELTLAQITLDFRA